MTNYEEVLAAYLQRSRAQGFGLTATTPQMPAARLILGGPHVTLIQAAAMYRAGFRWILVEFESGHERILDNIQKKATRDDNTRCMDIARRHGLKVKALMSVGHPGESEESVRTTHDWLVEVRPDNFDATVITTYPAPLLR